MRTGLRPLLVLMTLAVAVSVVHYADNYVNYADYPQPDAGSALPNPPAWLVGGAWFVFTAFGTLGVWLFWRGRVVGGAVSIAVYSGSGLVGIAHYLVPGATGMVWWRQAHVVADIICGVLLFAFALWAVATRRERQALASVPR